MSEIARKIIDQKSYVLEFVTTVDADDKPVFAYLLMPASQLKLFREKLETEPLELAQHGVIIAIGDGHMPGEETKRYVLGKFPDAAV